MQAAFQAGSGAASKANFDYATEMFEQCVKGDPGNAVYVTNLLGNLVKKYNNNKTGAKLAGMRTAGNKTALKKCELQKDYEGILHNGLEVLKLNPWDVQALFALSAFCRAAEYNECELAYLRVALEGDLKDAESNRRLGEALARQGQFDQAIACFSRVLQAKPGDEDARRQIAHCTVNKTITRGGYEDAESSQDVKADKLVNQQQSRYTPVQLLERAISKDPANLQNYLELSALFEKDEKFAESESVLQRALQAAGGDLTIRERLEDVQLRLARQQLTIAEQRAKEEQTKEAAELFEKLKLELNAKEMEVYRARSERYPQNLGLKYELGLRLAAAGNYAEAIKVLQAARSDTKRKGAVLLRLGDCFQHLKQYKLAMTNYVEALAEITERDPDLRKLALYRAGVLAMGLKDWEAAEKHLTELASLDFGYRDVAQRLDKLNEVRDK